MGPVQDELICFKDSENILHEILDQRAREGHTKDEKMQDQFFSLDGADLNLRCNSMAAILKLNQPTKKSRNRETYHTRSTLN